MCCAGHVLGMQACFVQPERGGWEGEGSKKKREGEEEEEGGGGRKARDYFNTLFILG